ncbi:trypsin-like serine protease [Longispora sp. K20-0274]|uniref:trypsin-like serine protease n=1 Tax=Longispora sp. K20-0274 TaxID=3088255 RepID=UPI00399B974C
MSTSARVSALVGLAVAAALVPLTALGATPPVGDAVTPESQYVTAPQGIVGGSTAHVADYPYVILGTRAGGPRPQGASCTGSVVAPRKILIAAHCKYADGDKRFLYGLDNFADPSGGTWVEVVDYKAHPNYNSNNGWQTGWDVAVVTVDRDIPVPAGYRYPRVAGSNDAALTAVGKTIHFVGYGRISLDENTSSILKQADFPIVAGSGCQSILPSYNADYMVCAGYPDGHDSICQGDSGGGALVDGVIVGVSSFVKTGCNGLAGFGRLTNAMGDWANQEISGTGPGPSPSPSPTSSPTPSPTSSPTGGPGQAPTASAFVSCQQAACQFDGQFSRDPDGTIVGYAWAFGDGATGTGRLVNHTYPARAGSYTARLTVTDDSGRTGTTTRTISCQQVGTFLFCHSL